MTSPDTTNALDVIEEDRKFLIGTEAQIKIWKTMFGNGVDYIIGNKIKGEG